LRELSDARGLRLEVRAGELVSLALRGVFEVGRVEELLDAEEEVLDRERGHPVLVLREDGEADLAGGEDIRVEDGGVKVREGRAGRVVLRKGEDDALDAALPGRLEEGKEKRGAKGRKASGARGRGAKPCVSEETGEEAGAERSHAPILRSPQG
jgi:hypothetical protein